MSGHPSSELSSISNKNELKRLGWRELQNLVCRPFTHSSKIFMSFTEMIPVNPANHDGDLDVIHIDGGLYNSLTPSEAEDDANVTSRILLRFVISFTLSQPLHVKCFNAYFEGAMELDYMGQEIEIPILRLEWMLCKNEGLHPYKKYEFKVAGEIPSSSPPSLETAKGRIQYRFSTQFDGIRGQCSLVETLNMVNVKNSCVRFDSPRQGLEWGCDREVEMVGTSVEIWRDLKAFIRYPDQWFNGPCPFA